MRDEQSSTTLPGYANPMIFCCVSGKIQEESFLA